MKNGHVRGNLETENPENIDTLKNVIDKLQNKI